MTDTNSWNNNFVAAFKIKIIWYVDFIWIEYSFLVSQKFQNIRQREFIKSLLKCLRSVEGNLNLTISNSSADFAVLSAHCSLVPIWLGIQQLRIFYPDWKHNDNWTIYSRWMDYQYSYYQETVNRKLNLKIL